MGLHRSRARSTLISAVVALLVAASGTVVASPSGAQTAPGQGPGLGKEDRELLAEAIAADEPTVTVLIAAKPGATGNVAASIQALGGQVQVVKTEVDYLRAVVPTGRAEEAALISSVQAIDLDDIVPLDDPRPAGMQVPVPFAPPDATTPRSNTYMPVEDIGAAQFTADNPTFDGRGVTVGVLDSGIDLDHPALATTTTGEPKIIDWVTYTHPTTDNDPTWVSVNTAVTGRTFRIGGITYKAPGNGPWNFGTFNERDPRLGGEVGNDVNRDGNPGGSSGIFAVLWDRADRVWVDTDQDRSFLDEMAMTNYRVNRDVGHFGVDNPATPVTESMPFVVQIEARLRRVNIGIVSAQHGSHVAGIVAANGMFGGEMSGVAPGAQLVSVRVCLFITGCTNHALIEGMIYAVVDAGVDVVNMSIGGLPSLNDANNARAVLYDRLISRYDVQMFISAGNSGSGVNTVGDPSVATKVMSVGTYISDATWESNYGSLMDYDAVSDNQHPFSSRGPREDGGFKPQIIAPGAAISTTPLWQPGGPVLGVHTLPPGYSMLNGTSMASPQAAGAGALLVGAAAASGVGASAAQLRKALNSSAHFIDHVGAHEQGNGLVDVGAAWALLSTNALTVPDIVSAVPVSTSLSFLLPTPNVGLGIHDREGVVLGESYTRTYTFTQLNAGPRRTYNLSLVGNDGTFALGSSSIMLRKGDAPTVTVTIDPASHGAHSAILNLDDPSNPGIEYQTMNTVVVPYEFTADGGFEQQFTGTIGRNQYEPFFFRVPVGTPAFSVDFSGPSADPGTGQARFIRVHPFGVPIDSNSSLNCYIPDSGGGCLTGSASSRTVTNPAPGVWEIDVEARRTSDLAETPFSLTATVLGASVSPDPDIIPSATIGVPVDRSYTITNVFGPFVGRATGSTLGSASIARRTIADLEVQEFPLTVTPGSTSLRATIGNPSDAGADLDLFVFNCTSGTCLLAGSNADGDSEESVTIANPAPGAWKVVVDGFAVPEGTTEYDYLDVFVSTAFGTVAITDSAALRPAGSSWVVPGTVTALAAPAPGRVLLGQVEVRTDTNVLIGLGEVIVESVSP